MKKLFIIIGLVLAAAVNADIDDVYYWQDSQPNNETIQQSEVRYNSTNSQSVQRPNNQVVQQIVQRPKVYYEDIETQHPDTVRVIIRR